MVVVRCPTGCGPLRRPYALRAVAVRCANCTAWFAAAAVVEDGSLVEGVLLARPGEALAASRPPRGRAWLLAAALALLVAALAAWAATAARQHAGKVGRSPESVVPTVTCVA